MSISHMAVFGYGTIAESGAHFLFTVDTYSKTDEF